MSLSACIRVTCDTPPCCGWLRHGNRPGDYAKEPRCGARTRSESRCRQPAMANGRCRMHGSLSTGPRTAEGLARARQARWKHGFASAETRALRRLVAVTCRDLAASVRLARVELHRRRAAAKRGKTTMPSSGGFFSLGMGSIEQISTSPPMPLDEPRQDSPASHKGGVVYVADDVGGHDSSLLRMRFIALPQCIAGQSADVHPHDAHDSSRCRRREDLCRPHLSTPRVPDHRRFRPARRVYVKRANCVDNAAVRVRSDCLVYFLRTS